MECEFNKKAIIEFKPIQPGDVKSTFADCSKIKKWTGYESRISISEGIKKFAKWYLEYFS